MASLEDRNEKFVLKDLPERKLLATAKNKQDIKEFNLAVCDNTVYPNFTDKGNITASAGGCFEGYEKQDKKFSGVIAYSCKINADASKKTILEITDAYEGVEVFINDRPIGIQITPEYIYDLTDHVKPGDNKLRIEVATTLERERGGRKCMSGITGNVNLYTL